MNNKVTFELSDLSYDELIETYREVLDFIKYLYDEKMQTLDFLNSCMENQSFIKKD